MGGDDPRDGRRTHPDSRSVRSTRRSSRRRSTARRIRFPTIYSRKFYEVQAHLSMTRHMLQNNTMIINKRSFDKLTPEFQKVVLEEAAAASKKNTEQQQARESSMLEDIRKSGKTAIVDNPDRAAFAAKMGPAMQKLESRWGQANLQRVRAAVDASGKQ